MGTIVENPNPEDDTPRQYDGYAKFCESKTAAFLMKKVENTGKNADAALGTANHPRLLIEHTLAQAQLDHAILAEKHVSLQQYANDQNTQLQAARAQLEDLREYVMNLPQRLLILENSYAHLMMQVQGNKYVDQIVQAYKIGQASDKG